VAIAVTNDASAFKRSANVPGQTAMALWGWFNFSSVTPARFWGPLGIYANGSDGAPASQQFWQISSTASGSANLSLFYRNASADVEIPLFTASANTWYFIAISCSALTAGNLRAHVRALTANTLTTVVSTNTATTWTPARMEWGRDAFTGDFISGSIHAVGAADAALSVDELLELSYFHEPQADGIRSVNCFYPCIADTAANCQVDKSGLARNATATPGALADSPALLWRAIPPYTPLHALGGSGAMTGATTLTFTPTGVLTGAGALAGASTLTFSPSATLTGSGSLVGASMITFSPSATLAGSGALVGASTLTFTPSATLTGAGALVGASTLTFAPAGVLTGTGALTGSATITFTATGVLADDVAGALSGSSSITFTVVGVLTGTGDLAGSTTLTFSPSGVLSDASAPPVTPTGPTPGGGGGGSGIDYQRIRRDHRRPNKEIKSLLDEALPEVYAELTAGPKEIANQAHAIVEPFKEASGIDWAALEADAVAVGKLLSRVARLRSAYAAEAKRAALQAHDENWFLMH
jgi:hypothetical protein